MMGFFERFQRARERKKLTDPHYDFLFQEHADELVSFDCEVVQTMSVGSHDVLFCQVKAMKQSYGLNALMYFNRGYCEPLPMC